MVTSNIYFNFYEYTVCEQGLGKNFDKIYAFK